MPVHSILDFGASNSNGFNSGPAIQQAIDACALKGGGRVLIPAGHPFFSGTIILKTGVELHLESGAMLKAIPEPSAYHPSTIAGEYGGKEGGFLIQSETAKNISITGKGVIDGNAEAFMDGWLTATGNYIRKPKRFRTRILGFLGCKNVKIQDVTIQNSSQWTCHLTGCEDVLVEGVTILNGLDIPNCDGIDPDHCKNVRISNCHIEAGDDGIVIKTTREFKAYGPSENITITGCTIVSTSSAVKIGTESACDIENVIVSSCIVKRSNRGLSIQLRDAGNVRNVIFADCILETRKFHESYWGNGEAIYITSVERHDGGEIGRIEHVVCRNILFKGENGVFLYASKPGLIRNIVLDGVHGTIEKTSRYPVDFYDLRPRHSQEHGGMVRRKLGGITAVRIDGLKVIYSSIQFDSSSRSNWADGIVTEEVVDLQLDSFEERVADG
jgi:polygalacturonase